MSANTQAQAPNQENINPEQKKLLETMNDLLLSAQELAYAVALIPENLVANNEELKDLVEAARNVVRNTYKFYKIIKKRGRS